MNYSEMNEQERIESVKETGEELFCDSCGSFMGKTNADISFGKIICSSCL